MKSIFLAILLLLSCLLFPTSINASVNWQLPVVTIVNPIRGQNLGHQHDNLVAGLQRQWIVTKHFGYPATWLWQYQALNNTQLVQFAKTNMKHQEFGLFFEIDRSFAHDAGVVYRGRGPWYFSDGLFLFSYDRSERKKLIDTLFAKFYKTFGYYPTTVGSWWMDADSLSYMQKKYGITAAFHAADQYNLDVYTIWGTPWSIPYLPSTENAGIPANSMDTSLHVVMMQWAPRDPLQGYGNSEKNGTYSLQDYELKGYDISYFSYLSSMYLKKPLDQIIVGIENGNEKSNFGPGSHYYAVLQKIDGLQKQHKITIALVHQYANAFLQKKNVYAPTHYFLTKDYQTQDQSFIYNGTTYRVDIQKRGTGIFLVDLRNYKQKIPEDFSVLPNSQGFLRIDMPSFLDSATMPQEKKKLLTSSDNLQIKKIRNTVVLLAGAVRIGSFTDTTTNFADSSINTLFLQQQNTIFFPVFWILFALFLLYVGILFLVKKNKRVLLPFLFAFIPLLFSIPFLTTSSQATFLLDKKEYIFLLPFFILPFSFWLFVFIVEILPFLLLLIFHYLFYVKFPGKMKEKVFMVYLVLLSIIYFDLPYFPLDRSSYFLVGMGLVVVLLFLFTLCLAIAAISKTKKVVAILIVASIFFFILLLVAIVTSRTTFAITPFERQALRVVSQKHEKVFYVVPQNVPIYKAVKPLISDSYRFGSLLTHTQWTPIAVTGNKSFTFPSEKFLLFVPRYVGSSFPDALATRYGLKKIFDNLQIVIFEKIRSY